ncbi:class I SAM-dependent methyltransferase [Sphingomonas mollis]|uniref:Methyltransferase domain-containing protein n=1 Tax=Sphingomonas mollis TaxID=2795726 RepID=A0ABS0XNT6_9SPHN|nr:SAM-dependent methyltransferase [Sphingomonas sp. BT553]MBJ6121704.1 methyltransferase domain-containing protein [Sphingomonas sp. BT553]
MPADHSLDASYFDGIFASDDDPWSLASSPYEAAKFDATIAAIADSRYDRGLEIGCAHGVLTVRLAELCGTLLAIDISTHAVDLARRRCASLPMVRIEQAAFPADVPADRFDLITLSEVVYYWSDADIAAAARAIVTIADPGCRLILVHWTGETDYPQSGDDAVTKLRLHLGDAITVVRADRTSSYRLDQWIMR